MRRAVIFRSLKGGRREDENKKKLEEGHKCDNSCRLYNLCCFSGRYEKKKKVKSLRPSYFKFSETASHSQQQPSAMEEDLRDGWMSGWLHEWMDR